jgi:hypothetical protein
VTSTLVALEVAQVPLERLAPLAAVVLEVVTSTLVVLEEAQVLLAMDEVEELPASISGWPPHAWRLLWQKMATSAPEVAWPSADATPS